MVRRCWWCYCEHFLRWHVLHDLVLSDVAIVKVNNWAIMSLMWRYPKYLALIYSLTAAAYQAGAVLPVVINAFVQMGVSLATALLIMAAAQLVICPALMASIPTQQEFLDDAEKVLGIPAAPRKSPYAQMIQSWQILGLDAWQHVLLCLDLAAGAAYASFYVNYIVPYATYLLHGSKAVEGNTAANLSLYMTAIIGTVSSLILATLSDKTSFALLVASQLFLLALFSGTLFIPSWPAVWVAVAANAAYNSINSTLQGAWAQRFAPPERVGMSVGIICLAVSLGTQAIAQVFISMSYSMNPGVARFQLPLAIMGLAAMCVSFVWCVVYYYTKPIPAVPHKIPLCDRK